MSVEGASPGDVEALAKAVLAGLRSSWRDDYSAQSVADGVARAVLASDWLADLIARRTAEVERATAERIAAAIEAATATHEPELAEWQKYWRNWGLTKAADIARSSSGATS